MAVAALRCGNGRTIRNPLGNPVIRMRVGPMVAEVGVGVTRSAERDTILGTRVDTAGIVRSPDVRFWIRSPQRKLRMNDPATMFYHEFFLRAFLNR